MAHGVLLEVAYDGSDFHGWAAQRDGRTVEETLRGALYAIDPHARGPRGTSRTDAGVHAEGQLAAFDTSRDIQPRGWVLGLNRHLPDDVAVRSARSVPPDYNPRFAARGKRYRYRVLLDEVRDPAWRSKAWRIGGRVDLDRMDREARSFVGTHDFAAFRTTADQRPTTVRTLSRVSIERDGHIASVVVEGNAFLHNMVRILVGTLVDVGRGHLPEGTAARALEEKDRRIAGTTAPAHGLVLEQVHVELPEGAGASWPP